VLHGFGTDGFFAEYAAVDYHNAIQLPEGINISTAAPFFCAGVTGMLVPTSYSSITYFVSKPFMLSTTAS
jgi:D-arabinose 1-dehydrogenase-like Zn-dependent alcohol dehydrogenase